MLPASYPRVLDAAFQGGFLDGVKLEFTPNLNCLIGGRGSGKSTALLAIRAALGAPIPPEEDPDDQERMPDETTVRFVDITGSVRTARRLRGQPPTESDTGARLHLRIADLGQGESGRLARGYTHEPEVLLAFLDNFLVTHMVHEQEAEILSDLADNAAEVKRTTVANDHVSELEAEQAQLTASLNAAQQGQLESVAEWATMLAAQRPLLDRLSTELAEASVLPAPQLIDIDALAAEYHVDLKKRAARFVDGATGLRALLRELHQAQANLRTGTSESLANSANPVMEILKRWQDDQTELETGLRKKQAELELQGLQVQAGAVKTLAERREVVLRLLGELKQKRVAHQQARAARAALLNNLHANRDSLFERRRATLGRITRAANASSDDLVVSVTFAREGLNQPWAQWLGSNCNLRAPRTHRLASMISPREFARALLEDQGRLLDLKDDSGPLLTIDVLDRLRTWDNIMVLETMRLEDRPRIDVREPGHAGPGRPFDHLSAGQQRSVLLSLLLCAERSEPLILDQPEDHLDAEYIASGVVRHLEAAKERRQVIIATHSPNLTVLGDAELVIPMHVEDGHGMTGAQGSVDRLETRDRVCALLEGGLDAYRKRGERYGLRFG